MKIAFRNFLTTLKRYKTASVLNIVGLTLAFMAFYIIMAQVVYNVSYNRSIEDSERVYLLSIKDWNDEWDCTSPRYTSDRAFELSPDVECGGVFRLYHEGGPLYKKINDYHYEKFDILVSVMSESMLDVFSFDCVEGNLHDMSKPDHLIIATSVAKKMGVKTGDVVYLANGQDESKPEKPYTIAGIYNDFERNTMLRGAIAITKVDDMYSSKEDRYIQSFEHYVKLREGANPQDFVKVWEDENNAYNAEDGQEPEQDVMRLVSLDDLYYSSIPMVENGTMTATVSLAAIAILVVLIAFINFVNFFFALIPIRLRTVNISKVFGASTATLRWSFIFEALGLAVLSFGLALYLMIAVKESFIKNYVTCSLALEDNLLAIGVIFVIVVVMALISSIYPSYYITSFAASLGVKGGFAGSLKGRRLRVVLATAQFAISIALIIVTTAIWLQYRHLVNADIGFNIDNVLLVKPSNNITTHYDAFMAHLEKNPNVEGVTAMDSRIAVGQTSFQSYTDKNGRTIRNYLVNVHHTFPKVMGIDILEGDGFKPELEKRQYLITKRAHQAMVVDDGDTIKYRDAISVVGVCENVELMSLADKSVAGNYMILVYDNYKATFKKYNITPSYAFFLVRVAPNTNIEQMKEFIRESVQVFDPGAEEPTIRFFRDDFEQLYMQTRRQAVLLSIFAVLSVIISLMGVFGIVLFEMQHRRREIAIRRVFGATTVGMLWMLNRRYARIVLACFVVAAPVAWYIVGEWQKDFAQQAPIGWWVYLLALLLVMGITLSLVTQRCWKAANENPADVVKSE